MLLAKAPPSRNDFISAKLLSRGCHGNKLYSNDMARDILYLVSSSFAACWEHVRTKWHCITFFCSQQTGSHPLFFWQAWANAWDSEQHWALFCTTGFSLLPPEAAFHRGLLAGARAYQAHTWTSHRCPSPPCKHSLLFTFCLRMMLEQISDRTLDTELLHPLFSLLKSTKEVQLLHSSVQRKVLWVISWEVKSWLPNRSWPLGKS